MVEDRLSDGVRIAQLLSSEITGLGSLDALTVVDADAEVEPTVDGRLAYRLERDGTPFAAVYVHPDRARIELREGHERAVAAAEDQELRVRPKAVEPPRTIVFVEDGAQVKRAARLLEALA
jgi:hypothetical protein